MTDVKQSQSTDRSLDDRTFDGASFPVIEERVKLRKERREVGQMRIGTRTYTAPVEIDEVLKARRVRVDRVPINRVIDAVPEIEERDGVLVMPVVEEVLVRQLVLREELHVHHEVEEREVRESIDLRYQEPYAEDVATADMSDQDGDQT